MQLNSKIFVTGGTGLVGSAIIRGLIKRGYTNIISSFHQRRPIDYDKSVKYYKIDFTNQLQTAHFFAKERPEYVFVASAKVGGIHANNTQRAQFIYENLQIACNVIHYSFLTDVKKLIFLGSSCIYPKECPQPMKEEYLLTSPLEYTNEPYAISKIAGLRMCESYNLQYGTNFISAMPTNLFGINDNFNLKTSHVLPALLRKFHLAKLLSKGDTGGIVRDLQLNPIGFEMGDSIEATLSEIGISKDSVEIWGSGKARREFLYVDDMVDGIIFLMEEVDFKDLTMDMKEIKNTHINIGSGQDISIKELAHLIKDIVGYEGNIVFNTSKPDGMMLKLLDSSRINKLGWMPQISLEDGIERVYKWYVEQSQ